MHTDEKGKVNAEPVNSISGLPRHGIYFIFSTQEIRVRIEYPCVYMLVKPGF